MSQRIPEVRAGPSDRNESRAPSTSIWVDPQIVRSSIGEAVYDWDIASDKLSWSGNVLSLFGVEESNRLVSGASFSKLMDPMSPSTRAEAILLCDKENSEFSTMSQRIPEVRAGPSDRNESRAPSTSIWVDPQIVRSSIGEAVYDWDIASDKLSWSGNVLSLFGVEESNRLVSGASFSKLMDPMSPSTRAEAILLCDKEDSGSGVPYRFSFAIKQAEGNPLWFEDSGRWFAGAFGRAAAAHGLSLIHI